MIWISKGMIVRLARQTCVSSVNEFRKIAVVGVGALGGYYGARLIRAGNNVTLIARSDLEVLRTRGLAVEMPEETFTVGPKVAAEAAAVGPCDLVLVTLKATARAMLKALIAPLVGDRTVIVTLENGLGSDEALADLFGADRIVGGLCFICVNRIEPGRVRCLQPGSVSFGAFEKPATPEVKAIARLFFEAGIQCLVSDNLAELRWRKLVWNIPFNGLAVASGGLTTDRLLASESLRIEVRALMTEVIAAAGKLGFAIPGEFADQQIAATLKMEAYRPSTLVDYLAGKEIEVEAIWGEPLRRAQRAGAEVPRLEILYALLKSMGDRVSAGVSKK